MQFLAASHVERDVMRSFCGLFYIITYCVSYIYRYKTEKQKKNWSEIQTYKPTGHTRSIRTYFKYLYARSMNKPVLVVCRALLFDSIINSIGNHRAHA